MNQLPVDDVLKTLNKDKALNKAYKQKAYTFHESHMKGLKTSMYTNFYFARSRVLNRFLTPEQRGVIFFMSVHKHLFSVNYAISFSKIKIQEDLKKEHFPYIVLSELNRLADTKRHDHLENGVDYIGWLERGLEPHIPQLNFFFIQYAAFVHCTKNFGKISQLGFLRKNGLSNSEDEGDELYHDFFKEEFIENSYKLIAQFKEKTFYDHWPSDLKEKFKKDINTPNPYNTIGLRSWDYSLEEFEQYLPFFKKIELKIKIEGSLPEKNNIENKRLKI